MTEKIFEDIEIEITGNIRLYWDEWNYEVYTTEEILDKLNKLYEENRKLKSENNMLKVTIGRNEAYINRMKHTSVIRN